MDSVSSTTRPSSNDDGGKMFTPLRSSRNESLDSLKEIRRWVVPV